MVRLGFLQCDVIDPPHVDIGGDYLALFTTLLAGYDIDLIGYRADRGRLPTSTSECDAWLIPGSRSSVFDDLPWLPPLMRFTTQVLEEDRPLIGVCFGHQLIARALGARVVRAPSGWSIGACDYRVRHKPQGDASGLPLTLIAVHRDQVLDLPAGTELLLEAPACPIAGFGNDSVLTVQPHPEFTAPLAASLYQGSVERFGDDLVQDALPTLSRPLHADRVAAWIASFLLDP